VELQLHALLNNVSPSGSDPAVLIKIADLYLDLGDDESQDLNKRQSAYEAGAQMAKRALELQEDNADAHYLYAANVGSAAQLKGNMASMLTVQHVKAHTRRALELKPDHAPALHMMGMIMEELPWFLGGDADAALRYLKRAIAADPSYIHARLNLAKAYIKRGALNEARRELSIILDQEPSASLSPSDRHYREEATTLLHSLTAPS
jgi:tetratricopeptide (TPR) repeat protein